MVQRSPDDSADERDVVEHPESAIEEEIAWPPVIAASDQFMQPAPGTTGRYLVLLRKETIETGISLLQEMAGVPVLDSREFAGTSPSAMNESGAVVFKRLGVAVVNASPDHMRAVNALSPTESALQMVEPERVVYAIEETWPAGEQVGIPMPGGPPMEYCRGYRDAVNHLVGGIAASPPETISPGVILPEAISVWNESELTWGLQATKAGTSSFTGRGVGVAILDTGLDLGHPDFADRVVVSESFVTGEAAQDQHGHGTHCAGTACGSRVPGQMPRYGVATDADIYVGKVLSNRGSGGDADILAGIEWALDQGCAVISMSLGAPVLLGQRYSEIFEQVARDALADGTLIIAAAGNDSHRPQVANPVSHPANCPSIMAVGALDQSLNVASFSNGTRAQAGSWIGQVDIAAPGVDVRSSWPRPTLYRSINGTSMATPHVAGITALFAEAAPSARGTELARLLLRAVRRLPLPGSDVGRGIAQAP